MTGVSGISALRPDRRPRKSFRHRGQRRRTQYRASLLGCCYGWANPTTQGVPKTRIVCFHNSFHGLRIMGRVERDVDGEVPSAISAADTWRRRRDVRLWVFDRVDQRSTRPPPPIPIPTSSEIPAEKRLRYPKLYLQTVTEGLGESPCVHIIPFMTSTQPIGNSMPLRLTRNSISPPPPGPARSVKKRPSLHCEYCKLRAFYHRCLGTHPFPVRLHPYLAASLSWPPTLSRNHRGRQIPFTASKNSVINN